jgi:hypothetical protein
MNDAQAHFGSCYAHFGACTWAGSTKMWLGTSKHILDGEMSSQGKKKLAALCTPCNKYPMLI